MEVAPQITVDSRIHHGKAVISGTRVPVSIIVGSLAGGMTQEEVSNEYGVTKAQIEAALAYAAEVVSKTEDFALAG
jgi:uncharacterized protein (DUF433 family)